MYRKALIEFMGPAKVKITTPLYQKEFDLHKLSKKNLDIDLTNLKTFKQISDHQTIFKIRVDSGIGTLGDPYVLSVSAQTSKVNSSKPIGEVSIRDKKKIFTVNFPD